MFYPKLCLVIFFETIIPGRSKCQRKIDTRVKMMFVSFSGGKIKTELENREGNVESMDEQVLMRVSCFALIL